MKDNAKRMKRQATGRENIFAKYTSVKELLPKLYKDLLKCNSMTKKPPNNQIRKWARRKTTILQPVDQKPQLQKDREDEKAEGYVPDEGTRKNPRKTTK